MNQKQFKKIIDKDLKEANEMESIKISTPFRRGLPDLFIVYRGKVIFLELKRDKKDAQNATYQQIITIQKFQRYGVWAAIIWPQVWPSVWNAIKNKNKQLFIKSTFLKGGINGIRYSNQ